MPSTAGMPWSITAWASEPMASTSSWTFRAAAGRGAASCMADWQAFNTSTGTPVSCSSLPSASPGTGRILSRLGCSKSR